MENPPVQPTFDIDGNRMTMLDTGPRRLDALIALIGGAAHSLRMIYYIYVDDEAGARVRQALIDAQLRGVAVALIVDGMGSESAQNHGFFAPMRDAGIDVCRFVPRWGRRYLLRNHQKLVLADECRAIIGGFNVEDSYFGTPADQAWRDLGLLIEGPAAQHITGYFDALSRWAKRPRPPLRGLRNALAEWSEPVGKTRWLFGGPTRRLSPWVFSICRK